MIERPPREKSRGDERSEFSPLQGGMNKQRREGHMAMVVKMSWQRMRHEEKDGRRTKKSRRLLPSLQRASLIRCQAFGCSRGSDKKSGNKRRSAARLISLGSERAGMISRDEVEMNK